MKKKIPPLAAGVIAAGAATVGTGSQAVAEVPRVVADIAPIHSLVAQVMGDLGTPELILPPGASPHGYSLRPSNARAIQEADLVVWVGEDLAPWLAGPLETLGEDAHHISMMETDGILLLEFREGATFDAHDHDHGDHDHEEHAEGEHDHDDDHEEHADAGHDHDHDHEEHAEGEHDHDHDHEEHAEAKDHDHDHGEEHAEGEHDHDHGEEHAEADHDHDHDHDHGEEHAEGEHDHDHGEEHADAGHDHDHDHDHAHGDHDPHVWLHPTNAAILIGVIADELAEHDPENAATYAANADAAVAELDSLSAEITEILAPAEGAGFVVFHDAYQYFETAFGFPAAGAISMGDAADPSAARLTEVRERIQEIGAGCVGAEPQFDPGIVAAIAEGTDFQTVVMDPLGVGLDEGPTLYGDMMRGLATALAACGAES